VKRRDCHGEFILRFLIVAVLLLFSSECSSKEHSFQDAGKYHGEVALGTPAEKPPQWSAAWLQGTTAH